MVFRRGSFGENEETTPDNIPHEIVPDEGRPGAIDQPTVRNSAARAQEAPLFIDQGRDGEGVWKIHRELNDDGKVRQRRKMPRQTDIQSVIDKNCAVKGNATNPTQNPVPRTDREPGMVCRDIVGSTASSPQSQGFGAYSETKTSECQVNRRWDPLWFREENSKESKPDSFKDHKKDASRQ